MHQPLTLVACADIRRVITKDLLPSINSTAGATGMTATLPIGNIIMRWGERSNTILSGARQDPVLYVEVQSFTNAGSPANQLPVRNQFVQDVIEQLLLCKYRGVPHFGKNNARTFTHPTCPLKVTMQQQLAELRQLQAQHDPQLLFQPELFARLVEGSSRMSAGCDVRRECFCSSHKHCARYHRCVRSAAFPEYRVCKPTATFDEVSV
jgi:hypothetical protein